MFKPGVLNQPHLYQNDSLGWMLLRKPRKGQRRERRQEAESQTMLTTRLLKSSPQTGRGSRQLGPVQEEVMEANLNR